MDGFFEIVRFVGNAAWKVLPFFLLSMFLSVLVNMLDLTDAIRKAFAGREGLAVLLATAVGAFSPFCSCTVIPIIAGLLISGVPLAPVMSFWIASPTMDPEIFTLTVGILGWPLALSRLGASLALSLGAGYLTLLLCRLGYFSQILPVGVEHSTQLKTSSCCKTQNEAPPIPVTLTVLPTVACCSAEGAKAIAVPLPVLHPPAWWESGVASVRRIDWKVFSRRMGDQSWRLGRWLLVAFTLEAIITMYVPQETIVSILGDGSRFGNSIGFIDRSSSLPGKPQRLAYCQRPYYSRDAAGCSHCLPDRRTRYNHPGNDGSVDRCPQAHFRSLCRH